MLRLKGSGFGNPKYAMKARRRLPWEGGAASNHHRGTSSTMATRKLTTTTNSVQRALAYARVSTDQQADSGISLEEQQRKIESRCRENGWNLERIYVDA